MLGLSISKVLALLIAGALASVLGGFLVQILSISTGILVVTLVVAVVFLLLYGSGAISKIWHWYKIRRRKSAPKVGILNDMEWDLKNKEIYTATNINPKEWKKEIEELVRNNGIKISVDLIKAENYFDKYNAIINPYGGVYPEYDLKNFKTLNEICNYIKEGGLFVNVADIPGYFACNPSIKPWRKIDTALKDAPYAYQVYEDKLIVPVKRFPLFHLVPFTRELGVDIYKTEDFPVFNWGVLEFENEFKNSPSSDIEVKVHRAAVVKEYIDPIIKPKEERNLFPQGKITPKITPLFFVRYGDGKLLASLIWENHNEGLRDELKKMLAGLVLDCIQIQTKIKR